jgi:hypothetical protein
MKSTVHAVTVMGQGLSLPLTFGTLRAFKEFQVLPSRVLMDSKGNLPDELDTIQTIRATAQACSVAVPTEDQVAASAKLSQLRKEALAIHLALVMMFGPEEEPEKVPKADQAVPDSP